MARNNEQPPGSLRLTRRQQQALVPPAKPVANTKRSNDYCLSIDHVIDYSLDFSPPSTAQSRPGRVFEWVHTQVARFDE